MNIISHEIKYQLSDLKQFMIAMKPVDWDCIDRLVMQQISDKVAVQDDLQTLSHSHSV